MWFVSNGAMNPNRPGAWPMRREWKRRKLRDELPVLKQIAALASDPLHTYGTDEDNWLGPWAVDPTASAWDLGSDALQFARDRVALLEIVTPELEGRLLKDGDAYHRLRAANVSILWERIRSVLPAAKLGRLGRSA